MSFKRLDPEDFVVSADAVSSTVWSGNVPNLTTFFTSSTQETGQSGEYYLNVLNTASDEASSAIQYAIAYGDDTGGGAAAYNYAVNAYSPSTTIYGSYRTLVLEDENAEFIFGDVSGSYFYALSIDRARYKESLFPGSLNLQLSSSVSGQTNALVLTDNSQDVTTPTYYGTQRAYQIVSGSNGSAYNKASGGTGYTTNSGSYGLFLPDIATIILNGAALDENSVEGINLGTDRTENTDANNAQKLFLHMSGSATSGGSFFGLGSQETITSDYVFVRARSSEFNYSENPSFISGSTGEVIYSYFINNPNVFPTTVGLYNDNNDLLAVAKLSKPILKDFTKEALIRVKLDF